MSFETELTAVFERRANDVRPRATARTNFQERVTRSHQRRVVGTGMLATVALIIAGMGISQIPNALQGPPTFADGTIPGTVRFEITTQYTFGDQEQAFVQRGAADLVNGSFHATGPTLTFADTEVRSVDDLLYVRLQSPVDGKNWIVGPPDDLAILMVIGLPPGDTDFRSGNPMRYFDRLSAVAERIEEIEGATVRGVETSGYKLIIDAEAYRRSLPEEYRGDPQEWEEAAERLRPIRVWVGEDGLVRRTQFTHADEETSTRVQITVDLFDWGVDETISPPAPGDTIEVEDINEFLWKQMSEETCEPTPNGETCTRTGPGGTSTSQTFTCTASSIEGEEGSC